MRSAIPVFLISAILIAFQIALIQILSIVQWHHFAYMAISIALLGFGSAGSVLAIFRRTLVINFQETALLSFLCCAISILIAIPVTQAPALFFDSYLVFYSPNHFWRFVFTGFIYFLPFFFGALVLGMIFVMKAERIGKIYFANLIGSAVGGLLILFLMNMMAAESIPAILSILTLVAALIFFPERHRGYYVAIMTVVLSFSILTLFNPRPLQLSQYKDLARALDLPESKIELERNSTFGNTKIVTSPVLRNSHDVGLNFSGKVPVQDVVFRNGDYDASILPIPGDDSVSLLSYTPKAFPYSITNPNQVLILNSNALNEVLLAGAKGVKHITVVDPVPEFLEIFQDRIQNLQTTYPDSELELRTMHARSFLKISNDKFNVISVPDIGTFGGSSGINSVSQDYLLTVDAFREIFQKLTSTGVISVSVWMDIPMRSGLKLSSIIMEALKAEGVEKPSEHLLILKNWGTLSFFIRKSKYGLEDFEKFHSFCLKYGFEWIDFSESSPNELSDEFHGLKMIIDEGDQDFVSHYPFRINPPTDDRPYFYQFLAWKGIRSLLNTYNTRSIAFLEIGYLLVWVTLMQIVLLSLVLIMIPILLRRNSEILASYRWPFFFFSGIGLGFIFVEINILQQTIPYLGNPVTASATVITLLLLISGLGSYLVDVLGIRLERSLSFLLLIPIIIVFMMLIFQPMIQWSMGFGFGLRVAILAVFLAPGALLMGIPFPLAIKFLSKKGAGIIPWAWGINGFFSVIGTVIALIISIEFGFRTVWLFAAGFYLLPVLSILLMPKNHARN